MKIIHAQINHGRWIAICPRCAANGMTAALEVKPGDVFVCPEEHPDTMAVTYMPNPRKAGAFDVVPDDLKRAEARQTALRLGSGFEVLFPAEKADIERALRARPVAARNWRGESVAEIIVENEQHGLK